MCLFKLTVGMTIFGATGLCKYFFTLGQCQSRRILETQRDAGPTTCVVNRLKQAKVSSWARPSRVSVVGTDESGKSDEASL